MICKYRCDKCMPSWMNFLVRERKPDEDLMEWMDELREAADNAHSIGSFGRCDSPKVDLYIPLPNLSDDNKGIGHK